MVFLATRMAALSRELKRRHSYSLARSMKRQTLVDRDHRLEPQKASRRMSGGPVLLNA